ncbi:DUF6531 domain-containing protein [Marinobacter bohaiensis]|uniref:DUF6531 domain-containing protein n=1 Tax=Marinobacter bohaiensis TaxID=2201898 RepID=UPI0013A6B52A|nr:DUF6531 domain-containing protein [Marinobacter bohaiensis]
MLFCNASRIFLALSFSLMLFEPVHADTYATGIDYEHQNCKGDSYPYGYYGPEKFPDYPVKIVQKGQAMGAYTGASNCMEFKYRACPAGTKLDYLNRYGTPYCIKEDCWGDSCVENPDRNLGKPDYCTSSASINPSNGNVFKRVTDFSSPELKEFNFEWTYNSKSPQGAGAYVTKQTMGSHRLHSFDRSAWVNRAIGQAVVLRPDGKTLIFKKTGVDGWQPPKGVTSTLRPASDITGDDDGYEYIDQNGNREYYYFNGSLAKIVRRDGTSINMIYRRSNHVYLERAEKSTGEFLEFEYEARSGSSSRLRSVTTSSGQVFTYSYDGNDNLSSVSTSPAEASETFTVQYLYENEKLPHAITGVKDENGNTIRTWSYDEQGRAIGTENADGTGQTTVQYNQESSTTVTNALGLPTIYSFEEFDGKLLPSKIVGESTSTCPSSSFSSSYNDSGFLVSSVDREGNVTEYERDSRGRETSRKEGVGSNIERITKTEWNDQFNKPARILKKDAIVQFEYDKNGNIVKRSEMAR